MKKWKPVGAVVAVVAVMMLTLAGASSVPAVAPPSQWVGVTSATLCGDSLLVRHVESTLTARHWVAAADGGTVRLEVHEVSGRSQPGGVWFAPDGVRHGEGAMVWAGWGKASHEGTHIDLARVVIHADDGASMWSAPVPITSGATCA